MSILLEALRKSEKNRHPQKVPTIHSGDQTETVSEPLKLGPLAFLLIVALFVSGWFVWRQYQAPAGAYQPPVTLATDKSGMVTEPVKEPQAGSGGVDQATVSAPATDSASPQKRTPVESYTPATAGVSKAQQANSSKASANNPANSGVGSKSKQAKPQAGRNTSQSGASATKAKKPAAKPTQRKPAAKPAQRKPQEPAPISYWELPDAIRTSVPEIKYSVLVYAADPADRFVLINGQRLGEGDSLPSGPVVKEIRRDGVIFSYRLYQFLVER